MIEDTVLTRFEVSPIDPGKVISSEPGEIAYALKSTNLGSCKNSEEEKAKLENAESTKATVGFELDCECDMYPYELDTFTADKKHNANYSWGDHAPGEEKYQEPCRFKPGEKVLCVVYDGYYAVIPAVVVGPVDKQFISQWYKDELNNLMYSSLEKYLADVSDWTWDEVIVRPLVRLKNDWEEMGEMVSVQRVYIFPFKTFEL